MAELVLNAEITRLRAALREAEAQRDALAQEQAFAQANHAGFCPEMGEQRERAEAAERKVREWENLFPENLGDYFDVIARGEMLYWRLEAELMVRGNWIEARNEAERKVDEYRQALQAVGEAQTIGDAWAIADEAESGPSKPNRGEASSG